MKQSFSIMAFQFAAAAIVSLGAAAVRAEDYSTWMQLAVADAYGFTAAAWVDPADETATKVIAEDGKSYYVPATKRMYLGGTAGGGQSYSFVGDVMAVAGTLYVPTWGCTYAFDELQLLPGSLIGYSSHGRFNGKIVILGTAESPVKIAPFNYGSNHYFFYNTFEGGSDAVVDFACTGGNNGITKKADHESAFASPIRFAGSCANYFGTMLASTNACLYFDSNAHEFPGRIVLKGGILYNPAKTEAGSVTIGSLDLWSGSELNVPINDTKTGQCAPYNVTRSLSFGDNLTVTFSSFPLVSSVTLFRLSGEAAANAPDVSGVAVNASWGAPITAHLEVVDNGDGTKDVKLVNNIKVFMTKSNGSYKAEDSAFTVGNESYWSTGVIPDSTFEGLVYCGNNYLTWTGTWADFPYPDMEVSVGSSLRPHVQSLTLKAIHVTTASGSYMTLASYNGPPTTTINAPMHLVNGGDVRFEGRGNHLIVMNGVIDGAGGVQVMSDIEKNVFSLQLLSENTFGGAVTVHSRVGEYDPATSTDKTGVLKFGKAANLGGAYVGTTPWKAFNVNNYSKVILTDSVTLDDATRGLYVDAGARFEVPADKTLAINYPITFGGEMIKLGAGRLELGGTVQFYDAATKAPVADPPAFDPTATLSNLLTVAAGSLKVTSAAAVDGVQVAFAEGTTLVVDAAATGDLWAFGAKNVKWETPFVSSAEDGKIAVAFEGELAGERVTVPVCTISATATAPTFALPRRYGHHKVVASGWKTNEDGTRTFEVTLEHQGLLLLVK